MTIKKVVIIVIIFIVGVLLLWGAFFSNKAKELRIKREITKAGYCKVASDCVVVPAKCPFNCYAAVNKSEADHIESIIEGHASHCVYQCIEIKGVDCIYNKCQVLR